MPSPQQFLSFFIHNPLGEEILEGTAGGLLAGAGTAAGGDTTFADALIKTGSAVVGGIGFGIAGRRLGARLGKKIQPKPLKDQDSMIASVARMGGSETTLEGVKAQGNVIKGIAEKALVDNSVYDMVQMAKNNPVQFQKKYNISPESMIKHSNSVKFGPIMTQSLDLYKDLDPAQRKIMTDQLFQRVGLDEFGQVEKAVRKDAVNNIDAVIEGIKAGELDTPFMKKALQNAGSGSGSLSGIVTDMMAPRKPVTGQEVGRFLGRVAGDEIGVLGGLGVGSMISSGLGIDSPKDKKIKELQKKLLNKY